MYENIVLSPGHGTYLPGAVNSSLNAVEHKIMLKFMQDATELLKNEFEVNLVWDDSSKSVSDNIKKLLSLHKKYDKGNGKTLHIFGHINSSASVATGYETLYKNSGMLALATDFSDSLSKVIGIKNRGVKLRTDLGMLNGLSHSILPEFFFINNKSDVDNFYKNYNKILNEFVRLIKKYVKNKKGNNKVEVKVETKVEVKNEMVDIEFDNTARKESIELIKKCVKYGIYTDSHKDVEKYSNVKLMGLTAVCLNRLIDKIMK